MFTNMKSVFFLLKLSRSRLKTTMASTATVTLLTVLINNFFNLNDEILQAENLEFYDRLLNLVFTFEDTT